jgi:hypothetical protein
MFNQQQKLLAEQRKIDEEFRQMEDEDFRSQFCSLPDEIKLLCKKKSEYEHYISELKYKKNIIHKFNTEKMTANDTLTWDNGRPVIRIKGINYHIKRIFSSDFRGGVYRHTITKEIIEDYKKQVLDFKTALEHYVIKYLTSDDVRFITDIVDQKIKNFKPSIMLFGIYNAGKAFDDWRRKNPLGSNMITADINFNRRGDASERIANFSKAKLKDPIPYSIDIPWEKLLK